MLARWLMLRSGICGLLFTIGLSSTRGGIGCHHKE
jgi:hypothetical protein